MNKIIRLALLCIIAFVGLYACGGPSKKTETLNYGGVSFNYPANWKVLTEDWKVESEQSPHAAHFIKVKGDGAVIMISISPQYAVSSDDNIGSFLKKAENNDLVTTSTKAIKPDKFGKYTSRSADYLMVNKSGGRTYGAVHVFEVNEKTILVAKQSNSEKKLARKFKDIEASFLVMETESSKSNETKEE